MNCLSFVPRETLFGRVLKQRASKAASERPGDAEPRCCSGERPQPESVPQLRTFVSPPFLGHSGAHCGKISSRLLLARSAELLGRSEEQRSLQRGGMKGAWKQTFAKTLAQSLAPTEGASSNSVAHALNSQALQKRESLNKRDTKHLSRSGVIMIEFVVN